MRILLISVKSEVSVGGVATWTERFLDICESHGVFCELVNTEIQGKRAILGTAKRNFLDEFFRTLRIFKDLKNALKKDQYDAVHLNTSCGNFGLFRDYLVAKKIKKQNLRLVTHFHCDIPYWIHNFLNHKYLAKLVKLSDERLVLCENSRKYLMDNFGASSSKVPNFITDESILDGSKVINQELATVAFVGRVSVAKGAKELYEVAKQFPDITFKLIGNVAIDMADVQSPKNVKFSGSLPYDQVLSELDSADAFLFPTHSEGFSLSLTEAMARGVPAVATDVGANADMLEGGCGFVTAVGDITAMVEAIEKLKQPDIREQMSQNALSKVKESYTADVIIKYLKNHYNGIC